MPDFSSLLNINADDVKAPVPLPAGTYLLLVLGYEFVESGKKKTPGVQINFAVREAIDVAGDLPDKLSEKKARDTFWITEDSVFRLKEFIENCGIATSGRNLSELLPDLTNQTVVGQMVHRPNPEDPTRVFSELRGYAKS